MLLLRDSINAPLIPRDTPVVAGYGDGRYLWSPSWLDGSNWWDLFPAAVHLVIVVFAPDAGDILDVETSDATPAEAPGWCQRFSRAGRRAPTIYCNRGTWPAVVDQLRAAGVDPAGVDWWIGTLDGTTDLFYGSPGVLPPLGLRVVAVQVADVGAYDESVILDPSWVGLEDDMTPEEHDALMLVKTEVGVPLVSGSVADVLIRGVAAVASAVGVEQAALDGLNAKVVGVGAAQAAAKTELDQLLAAVEALAPGVPPASLQPVLDSLARLSAHLGVGTS